MSSAPLALSGLTVRVRTREVADESIVRARQKSKLFSWH